MLWGSSPSRKIARLLVIIFWGLAVCGPARAAGRLSFEAIDAEPLDRVSPGGDRAPR